jgi:phytoene dehydrogenase-like protein
MNHSNDTPAIVVGSGPNGLAAAVTLARAGLPVQVYERNETIGGACRSTELIKPGVIHDIGSAIHPLAVNSSFLPQLHLERYGLRWITPPVAMAHPLDDGTAAVLYRSVEDTASAMDAADGKAYKKLLHPLLDSENLIDEIINFPRAAVRHPFMLAGFGLKALLSASGLAHRYFRGNHARAIFAGLGAHSIMDLDSPGSIAPGLVLGLAAHLRGWPMPEGGAQKISDALAGLLTELGGMITTGTEVRSLEQLPSYRLLMLDVTPGQFARLGGNRLPVDYVNRMKRYHYGPGVFKVDWILDSPVPWKAAECRQAGTVHVGGTLEEIVSAEKDIMQGRHPEKPFVLLAQPGLFDPSRSGGKGHVLWGYCHVPNGSTVDMTEAVENQIERFAPGFGELVNSRHIMAPADMEKDNPNCVGGEITGGAQSLRRLVMPAISYNTPLENTYLCSSSIPPGPGVHGMCGFKAAGYALSMLT